MAKATASAAVAVLVLLVAVALPPTAEAKRHMLGTATTAAVTGPCALVSTNMCGVGHTCVPVAKTNTYTCSCKAGYRAKAVTGGQTCVDIDECHEGKTCVTPNTVCVNTEGGYTCDCAPGWVSPAQNGKQGSASAAKASSGAGTVACVKQSGDSNTASGGTIEVNACLEGAGDAFCSGQHRVGCTDAPVTLDPTGTQYTCGACQAGFSAPDATSPCTDINACTAAGGNAFCSGQHRTSCGDVPAAEDPTGTQYTCDACAAGYSAPDASSTCTDINACSAAGGSAFCAGQNRASCSDVPAAQDPTGTQYTCGACNAGYSAPDAASACTDTNACLTAGGSAFCAGQHRTGCSDVPAAQDPTGTQYTCDGCAAGYGALTATGTCTDVDACSAAGGAVACAGQNRAGCTDIPASQDPTGTQYMCGVCMAGYSAPDASSSCTDTDACATAGGDASCAGQHRAGCTDVPAAQDPTGMQYTCGACNAGYSAPDATSTCTDIDACAHSGGSAFCTGEHRTGCTDTPAIEDPTGTLYTCDACESGYSAPNGASTCTDIDACATAGGNTFCAGRQRAMCIDVAAARDPLGTQYTCGACNAGYSAPDPISTCTDIDACATAGGDAFCAGQHRCGCTDVPAAQDPTGTQYTCGACDAGYSAPDAASTCTDINACLVAGGDASCAGQHRSGCSDVPASQDPTGTQYTCGACNAGYSAADATSTCTDIDACATAGGAAFCAGQHRTSCTDMPASQDPTGTQYTCGACEAGYAALDGTLACADINACELAGGNIFCAGQRRTGCSDVPAAQDPAGAQYTCGACAAGYSAPDAASTCTDIDACVAASGSAFCTGKHRSGCTDVPAAQDPTGTQYTCGACSPGYFATSATATCTDIDACEAAGGSAFCAGQNRAGCTDVPAAQDPTGEAFTCDACIAGYHAQDASAACMDIDACSAAGGLVFCAGQNRASCTDAPAALDPTGTLYTCGACEAGNQAPDSSAACEDIDGCANSNGGAFCQAQHRTGCEDVPAEDDPRGTLYTCGRCLDGYGAASPTAACADLDACSVAGGNAFCAGQHRSGCTDKPAAQDPTGTQYTCGACSPGYSATSASAACTDINACLTAGGNIFCAGQNRQGCTDVPASQDTTGTQYKCGACISGYSATSAIASCTDINACTTAGGNTQCSNKNRTCSDTPAAQDPTGAQYTCGACFAGYSAPSASANCQQNCLPLGDGSCLAGIATNVNTTAWIGGWTVRLDALYGTHPDSPNRKGINDLFDQAIAAGHTQALVGCGAAGSGTLMLLAGGALSQLRQTTSQDPSFCGPNSQTRSVNGAWWYNVPNWSFGFADTPAVALCAADVSADTAKRLSWHTSDDYYVHQGWRCGGQTNLNYDMQYRRVVMTR